MKSKLTISFFFLCIFSINYAQNLNESNIYLQYDMYLNFHSSIKYSAELISNSKQSLYKYKLSEDELTYREENIDTESKIDITIIDSATSYVYFDNIEKLMTENRKSIYSKQTYFIKDSILNINWNLLEESKLINDMLCKKAICNFKGRNYTAWYCPTIPISNGPWKLIGLPGLIFEAIDEENQVAFYLKKLVIPCKEIINNDILKEKKYLTEGEFIILQEKEKEEFQSKMATKFGRGTSVKIDYKVDGIEK
ncbi:GLPGLI family protein [Flavobacterium sp.]|uniref:GLPGLI family protein n=1 Tax=Flavobacterium sp. TaxID=239 RepID=UPI003F69E800